MRGLLRLVLAACLFGTGGCLHAQTGPVIGVSSRNGPVVGWEAGAGLGVLSGSFGAEARPFGEKSARFYVAAEPGVALPLREDSSNDHPDLFLSLGSTVGYSADEHGKAAFLVGGFLGVPWIESGDCRDEFARTISVSLGVHVFIDRDQPDWTVYASPKLGAVGNCLDLRDSFRVQ